MSIMGRLKKQNWFQLLDCYPYLDDYFKSLELKHPPGTLAIPAWLNQLDSNKLEELGINKSSFIDELAEFINASEQLMESESFVLKTLTIFSGVDKSGASEPFRKYCFHAGDIVSVVGATGSGKSRFLGDIESLAVRDTPSKRLIELNDAPAPTNFRFSAEKKLVAQLSQNMNFVMDIAVEDFLMLHAESRQVADKHNVIKKVIEQANELTGEKFCSGTQLTQLSGGQSRALMIADTALISSSPVVLIDEIENAGVDRKKALSLFTDKGKIVFIATHDPLLALLAPQRLIIQNGAITKLIQTSDTEKGLLTKMMDYDARMMNVRADLRSGLRISDF